MTKRQRRIRLLPHFAYDSLDEFLSTAKRDSGTYSIKSSSDNHYIDVGVADRAAKTTLVTFNGALSNKTRYLPTFSGNRASKQAGFNLVSISDPSLALKDSNLDLAWYLGNKLTGPLTPTLAKIVKKILHLLRTRRTIIFGPSGGGYSAVNFARYLKNSTVLIINPRMNMTQRPHPGETLEEYLRISHDIHSESERQQILKEYLVEDLADHFRTKRLNFDLLIAQNMGDKRYLHGQVQPFYEALKDDPRLHLRFDKYSDTHSPIPSDLLDEILAQLGEKGLKKTRFKNAGFTRAKDIEYPAEDSSLSPHS